MAIESSGVLIDSAVVAAIISAVITIGFLIIREYLIEPKKWKKDAKKETLLKQIESYGRILSFLDAAEARKKNWKSGNITQVKDSDTHLFFLPGHEKQFNEIIRNNLAYFSNDIIEFHRTFIENDTEFYFAEQKWKDNQSSWIQGVNLGDMHTLIRTEFNEFRKKYEKMTGHSFEKS